MKHLNTALPGLFFLLLLAASSSAQNVMTEMDRQSHQLYDRMIVLSGGGDSSLHAAIKPYWRNDLVILADSFSHRAAHRVAGHQMQNIYNQNNEWVNPDSDPYYALIPVVDSTNRFQYSPDRLANRYGQSKNPLWHTFYKTPAFLYEVNVKDFYLRVNPILHLALGHESEEGVTTFFNQRGLSLRGAVGKGVYFQTSFYDSQVRYANYINRYTDSLGVVPGVALYKNFESSLFEVTEARDFLLANAYVGINCGKYIGIQLGHNQFFIGDGIRSLFLSDFSTPFFSLKINTRIWKFHYQNIFAEISADNFMSVNGISEPVPKKYMAAHYLSFKPNRNLSLGLFETVVFDRENDQFELQYLNPIILYRTVEGWLGSPDNVLLGFSARWDIKKTASAYGQFILDDISISQILDGHLDWWGNKFGYQLGVKYYNVLGIDFLDAQVEWNQMRPYTYSHYDSQANYSNYKQTLAHPLGANFDEWIVSLRYQPAARLFVQSNIHFMLTGEDPDSTSYGANVIKPNTLRPDDYGNHIGQGIRTNILFWSTAVQYELFSGLFVDLRYQYRDKRSDVDARSLKTSFFQAGLRYNISWRDEVF
jgi:hypothetical protein